MKKKSNLDRLAYKLRLWLPLIYWIVKLLLEIADFISKVVNYHVRSIRKLLTLIQDQGQAGLRAI